jgi:menaquinone-dependent protoporphyrinogen IX oxidase
MMSKILVAYYTKEGASEEYAKVIAETLSANGLDVEIHNLASNIPDITAFTTVILGTGVRMSMVYRRWRKILKQKTLGSKRLFMFLSSGTAIDKPDEAVEKFLRPVVEKYHLKPELLISLPGKMPEKWVKLDGQKKTMSPEKAKVWAQQIAYLVKNP